MKCRKHPTYKALRKPTANCECCRKMRMLELNNRMAPMLLELFHLGRMGLFNPTFPQSCD